MGKQKRCSPAAPDKDLPVLERRLMENAAQALLFVSAQKRQKILRGGKQKSQEATGTHVQHTGTTITCLRWFSTTDRVAGRASCVSEKRAQKHIYADLWNLKTVTQKTTQQE